MVEVAEDTVDLDREEIELEQEKLALRRQELALKERKLAVLRQRKGGENAATRQKEKGAFDCGPSDNYDWLSSYSEPISQKMKDLKKRAIAQEKLNPYNPTKLMVAMIAIPLALLCILVPLLQYVYGESYAQTPCQGICSINETMLQGYMEGCKALVANPKRLFFYVVPGTHADLLEPFVKSIMHIKSYEMMPVRNWRDAVFNAPVYLSMSSKKTLSADHYAHIYQTMISNQLHQVVPHNRLYMSSTYLHDLPPPNGTTLIRNDSIMHMSLFRHPLLRLREQYEHDRQRAPTGATRNRFRNMGFEECAKSAGCRHQYQFARWGNLMTKYMCGWSPEVCMYDKWLNATPPMLERALNNIEHKLYFVGLTEEWDATIEMMETMLPTYFEGFHANITTDGTCSSSSHGAEWCAKPAMNEETSSALTVASQELAITSEPLLDALLRHFVWADLILYEKAQELFYDRALLCGIQTLKKTV
mmetsp:Transcript_29105/g.42736  ORF Transcript_29105/g.42736 Transcript_29105/m.42736 type:complete len:475 (-) Transcript_29105:138-1562(-)